MSISGPNLLVPLVVVGSTLASSSTTTRVAYHNLESVTGVGAKIVAFCVSTIPEQNRR